MQKIRKYSSPNAMGERNDCGWMKAIKSIDVESRSWKIRNPMYLYVVLILRKNHRAFCSIRILILIKIKKNASENSDHLSVPLKLSQALKELKFFRGKWNIKKATEIELSTGIKIGSTEASNQPINANKSNKLIILSPNSMNLN